MLENAAGAAEHADADHAAGAAEHADADPAQENPAGAAEHAVVHVLLQQADLPVVRYHPDPRSSHEDVITPMVWGLAARKRET